MDELSSSPLQPLGLVQPLQQSPSGITRLDRILELVTDHEASYREQDIKLSGVIQKMSELEVRITHELAPLWALKERNVATELDLARTAVETVARQLTGVTQTNQLLKAELKACQQKQQQQQLAYESTIAVLQADIAAMRGRIEDSQNNSRAAMHQCKTSSSLQLEQQRQEFDEQLQLIRRDVASSIAAVRQEVPADTAAAMRALEASAKSELLQLATKLKAVVQGCASHQQQVNLQMEALQQQWDNTSAAIEALQAEDRRLKKHVMRLQQQTEELQRLSQQAIANEVAMQQVKNGVQQLHAAQQQLSARIEVSASSGVTLSRKVSEAGQQLATLDKRLNSHAIDLTRLAESVGTCLTAARADAALAAAAAPSSYLSTLLAPAGASSGAAATAGMLAGNVVTTTRQPQWAAWDHQLSEFDGFLAQLRKRLQHTERQCTRIQQAVASPTKPGHIGSPGR